MNKGVVFLLVILLSGCAVLDALGTLIPDKGLSVDTELVVGDKQQEVQLGDRSSQVAESIVNNEGRQEASKIENNIQNLPEWVILLLIIGWMAPSPSEIWRGLLGLFKLRDK